MTDELKGVVERYTTGGYKSINAQADLYLSGTPKEKAFSKTGEMLFDTVNKSQQSFESLYRIENVEGFVLDGNRIISSPLHQGQELTWGLRSTSKSEKFVSRAALGQDKNLPFVGGVNLKIELFIG
jgi:hypothetical protein